VPRSPSASQSPARHAPRHRSTAPTMHSGRGMTRWGQASGPAIPLTAGQAPQAPEILAAEPVPCRLHPGEFWAGMGLVIRVLGVLPAAVGIHACQHVLCWVAPARRTSARSTASAPQVLQRKIDRDLHNERFPVPASLAQAPATAPNGRYRVGQPADSGPVAASG
jgi:hypothetical protein